VEVLCTLHALLANLETGKMVLYPQVLLACIALLNSSVVRVVQLAMGILLQVGQLVCSLAALACADAAHASASAAFLHVQCSNQADPLQVLQGFNLDDAMTQNTLLAMLPLLDSAAAGAGRAGENAHNRQQEDQLAQAPWPLGQASSCCAIAESCRRCPCRIACRRPNGVAMSMRS
jgi:hypothetical protein